MVTERRALEDTMLDEYLDMLRALSDAQIRSLVLEKLVSEAERKTFESVSAGVSRETLTLLAGRCLVRQKLEMPSPSRP
jgi:hypothetical protein